MFEPKPKAVLSWHTPTPPGRAFRQALQAQLVCALLLASAVSHSQPAAIPVPPATPETGQTSNTTEPSPDDYLERANQHRQTGDFRREQFELTKALRSWPNSTDLRYAYALHLIRRKNLSEALVHTTYSLNQNSEQPAMANLHLLLLDGLKRPADSVAWLGHLLTLKRALPPLEPWSQEWVRRWQQVLQLGRQHADITGNTGTRALIDDALRWATIAEPAVQPNGN